MLRGIDQFEVSAVQHVLAARPELIDFRSEQGLNLLQLCCRRFTGGAPPAGDRQVRLAQWLVRRGLDPRALHTTAPGEDGEEESAHVSLAWFAVARAQNNKLARYFLQQGAAPNALFAAAWWGNADIVADLVRHGANINEHVGATPLHMAVDVLYRGAERKPGVARRRLKTLQEFLRLGADPNIPAHNGQTPLHTVVEKGYPVGVFTLLLRHGANPDLPGKNGRTVRQIAARKRDRRYVDALSRLRR